MSNLENRMYLVLGDWSDDGHGKTDKKLFYTNKTVAEIQYAYKASCATTGISFNHNEDFTGVTRDFREKGKHRVVTEYEQTILSEEILKVLFERECPHLGSILEAEDNSIDLDVFIKLWWWFTGLSLPGLKYESQEVVDPIPVINGYWDSNLNVQFGYGLYY